MVVGGSEVQALYGGGRHERASRRDRDRDHGYDQRGAIRKVGA